IAGIQAAKKTSDLIPLCHPLATIRRRVILAPILPRPIIAIRMCSFLSFGLPR
ncbi:MAG: hypothetical protein B7X78_10755, partial [Sphingomonadales bacterium 39-62-4]